MFDRVRIEYPLAGDLNTWEWTTQDFDCVEETYVVTRDGRLVRQATAWELLPPEAPEEQWHPFKRIRTIPLEHIYIPLQGDFCVTGHPAGETMRSATVRFRFKNGRIQSLEGL